MSAPDRDRCVTCSDEAVAGRVVEIDDGDAIVTVGTGTTERVATDLLVDVRVGDVLLCHAGIALDRLEDAR